MHPEPRERAPIQERWRRFALLVPPLLALLWYWDCLAGGFLSDDYLFAYYLDKSAEGVTVLWDRVLEEFVRPWFGVRGMYRPVVSLSVGFNLATGGVDPFGFHLLNLLAHVVTTGSVAILCWLYSPRNPALAAMIGGVLVAVHPMASESTCWISARNSGLEVALTAAAMAAFAGYLHGSLRSRALALILAAAALVTKEGAVILLLALPCLDLLQGTPRNWRERLRLHLPLLVLVAGYFTVRKLVLGVFFSPVGFDEFPVTELVANYLTKWRALLFPDGAPLSMAAGLLALLAFVWGSVRSPRVLVVGMLLLSACFASTYRFGMSTDLRNGRFVYGAVPLFALCYCCAGLGTGAGRATRIATLAAGLALIATLAPGSRGLLSHYVSGWRAVDEMQDGLLAMGEQATAERPLAVASLARPEIPLLLVHSKGYFALLQKPFAPRDVPVAGLGFVLDQDPNAPDLLRDATPIRALLEAGATVATWDPARQSLRSRVREPLPAPELRRGTAAEQFTAASHFAPLAVEVVDVEVEGATEGTCRIEWLATVPQLPEDVAVHEAKGSSDGERTLFSFDLSRDFGLLALDEVGVGLLGLSVQVEGVAAGRIRSVRLRERVADLPLAATLGGARLQVSEIEEHLVAPAGDAPMRLVLIGPHTGQAQPVEPGQPVRLTESMRNEIGYAHVLAREQRFWYFFQTVTEPGRSGAARSALDRFELVR